MRTLSIAAVVVAGSYWAVATLGAGEPAAEVALFGEDAAERYVGAVRAHHELHPMLLSPLAEIAEVCGQSGVSEEETRRIAAEVQALVIGARRDASKARPASVAGDGGAAATTQADRGVCGRVCDGLGIRTDVGEELGRSLDALAYGDDVEREEAARDLAAEGRERDAGLAVDELAGALGDSEAAVRAAAARALAKAGAAAAKAVPRLVEMLRDAPAPPESLAEPLGGARGELRKDDPRAAAAVALSRAGEAGQDALVALLSDAKLERRCWGAAGLAESLPGTAKGGELLFGVIGDKEDVRLRSAAAAALGVARDAPGGAGPALVALLDSPSVRVRLGAARGLGRLRPIAPGAEEKLLSLAGTLPLPGGGLDTFARLDLCKECAQSLCLMTPSGTSALAKGVAGMGQNARMMVLNVVGGLFGDGVCNQGLGDVVRALTECDDFVVAGHAAKLRGKICSACLGGCVDEVTADPTARVRGVIASLDTVKTEADWAGLGEGASGDDPVGWSAGEQKALAEACVSRLPGRQGVPRRVCVVELSKVARFAGPGVEGLVQILRDSTDPVALRKAVETLGMVGAPAEPALPLIQVLGERTDEVGASARLAGVMIGKAMGNR